MPQRETGAEPESAALARTAINHGLAALAARDIPLALRWLERAHRLVPHDANAALTLASACLQGDPAKASALFTQVADKYPVRQAWLGLAAAHLRLTGAQAAAVSLAMVLSRYTFSPDTRALAEQIGSAASGWCALRSDGTLELHPAVSASIKLTLDGRSLPGATLPTDWPRHRALEVRCRGQHLLGSPIQLHAIRRLAGCVEVQDGGIRGWAWHPADPDTAPVLTLTNHNGRLQRTIVATDTATGIPDAGPLARPRGFQLAAQDLAGLAGPVHLRGPDGTDMPGSPLDPFAEPAALAAAARRLGQLYPAGPAPLSLTGAAADPAMPADAPIPRLSPRLRKRPSTRHRAVTVVLPVHDGGSVVHACLASVLVSLPPDCRVLVVDDGSSDPALVSELDELARRRRISLLRHKQAMGFPISANAGIRAARGRDVVLLNSDTLVPAGWLTRLRDAAYAADDIGSVTPLSNDASIVSYPGPAGTNPVPDQAATDRLDRLASRANGHAVIDIPVGVGFCLYLRRDCLDMTGVFRADLFAQGYGEENDLCLRASRLGWRHVALTGLFVGHLAGTSFGPSASHLRRRNSRVLARLHPGYDDLISRFLAADPLAEARRRIDLLSWRQRGRPGRQRGRPGRQRGKPWQRAAILITHDDGGGVEQRLAHAADIHCRAGRRPIILRPTVHGPTSQPAIAVCDGLTRDLPNLVYAMPRELPALLRLLRTANPDRIEAHHLAEHTPAIYDLIARLGLPYNVHVHDYAWVCPRIALVAQRSRYCGEPDLPGCEDCVADHGHFLNEDIGVAALRARSAGFLAAAQRVIVPAEDVATRIRRYFPALRPVVVPHEDDCLVAPATAPGRRSAANRATGALEQHQTDWNSRADKVARENNGLDRADCSSQSESGLVCIVGAIGEHKGYDILLACARDAARRTLGLRFVVVGHTIDDARLMDTGRVFVTGQFQPDEAPRLIAAQHADFGFVPSICPETWCLGLGNLWRAGLAAAAFDIGAPAERIRRTGRGIVLPLGLPSGAINNMLLAAIRTAEPRGVTQPALVGPRGH